MAYPNVDERTVIKKRALKAPANTVSRECRMAIIAAMKNVLSPISLTKMTEIEATKACQKLSVESANSSASSSKWLMSLCFVVADRLDDLAASDETFVPFSLPSRLDPVPAVLSFDFDAELSEYDRDTKLRLIRRTRRMGSQKIE